MSTIKKPIKVLYNGAHSNLRPKKVTAQGGPSRFADGFRKAFKKEKDVLLLPFLFSGNDTVATPTVHSIDVDGHVFYELLYNKKLMNTLYADGVTRTTFLKHIEPIIKSVEVFLKRERPNIVFLNGFGVTNWILLYVAHTQKIPVVIQHAGIWKKEIKRKGNIYAPSVRKVLYQMERDTIQWCAHHIFLNTFSKKAFMHLYTIANENDISQSIVPLPIPLPSSYKNPAFDRFIKKDVVNIGMVARWDSIKNHSAMLRLATADTVPPNWRFHTVTAIPSMEYTFPKKYVAAIKIHKPMDPHSLTAFYRSMDVVVLPSHFDVSPTVVAESILANTPVIISEHVGWFGEFVRAGLSDHIIPTNASGRRFVRTVKHVLSNRKSNKDKYNTLVGYIRRYHAPKVVFEKYAKLFLQFANK